MILLIQLYGFIQMPGCDPLGGHSGNSAPMVSLNMQSVVTRELNIQGSYIYTDKDFRDCIRILSEQPQDFTGIISQIISVEEATPVFEELSRGAGAKLKVLVDMTSTA